MTLETDDIFGDANSEDDQPEGAAEADEDEQAGEGGEGEGEGDEDEEGDADEDDEGAGGDGPGTRPASQAAPGPSTPQKRGDIADQNEAANGEPPSSLGAVPTLAPALQDAADADADADGEPSGAAEGADILSGDPMSFAVRPEVLTASSYDIVPTIAAPQSTSINAIASTPDLRWVFTGGSDGYIRKFNWVDTANGKLMLTVAQRHPFVDSVTKAGVLTSYWENEESNTKSNEDAQAYSPVYALAVQKDALWLLSGLESGGISLQAVRHDEGKRIHLLKKHTSAVSVLHLASDERSVLSGSWDRTILDWDLNTGQVVRTFDDNGGQISAIEMRPQSSLPIPEMLADALPSSMTFADNNADRPSGKGALSREAGNAAGVNGTGAGEEPTNMGSPADSLFGDKNSLFGDGDDVNPDMDPAAFGADDYDNELSRALASGMPKSDVTVNGDGDVSMMDSGTEQPMIDGDAKDTLFKDATAVESQDPSEAQDDLANGTVTAGDSAMLGVSDAAISGSGTDQVGSSTTADSIAADGQVFLAASIDGSLRIWDKRQALPVARILPRNVPPWCTAACWAPDGNFIYAGRRNGCVEEFSLHKGFRSPERTFRFPNGSGPVSAVRAMPNGRHLVCASYDILRLYDLHHDQTAKHSGVPFLIVPGHRTGVISALFTDPTYRYMISTAGNRGWEGASTQVMLGYEINV